jgi:probable rRNA maturation factor
VRATLAREGRRAGEIAIRLTDDAELRALNRRWRGIDRATDVISFAYDEHEPDASSRPVAGDLVISLERVRAQARRFRVTAGAELARLVIHGTLHLAGLDHARAAERRTMRARENAALRASRVAAARLTRALRPA